jgi:hypothetical protein
LRGAQARAAFHHGAGDVGLRNSYKRMAGEKSPLQFINAKVGGDG